MTLQTKYITLDDFDTYFPEQGPIRELFDGEINALAFLKRIEDRMELFINSNFNRNIDKEYPVFTENMKEHYKKALLEQCAYIIKNSDITVDSGYDPERGEVMNIDRMKKIALAPNALDHLRMCGLTNRQLNNYRMKGNVWWMI